MRLRRLAPLSVTRKEGGSHHLQRMRLLECVVGDPRRGPSGAPTPPTGSSSRTGQARRGAEWMDHALLALNCSMSGGGLFTSQLAYSDLSLRSRDPKYLLALAAAE